MMSDQGNTEPPRLPAGITLQEEPNALRILTKDGSGRGAMLIALIIGAVVMAAVYCQGAVFTTPDIVFLSAVALALVVALYAAIGFIVNTKTILLTDEVLFVQTRPLPFHRTRRVPVSGIERVRVEDEHRSQHTNFIESVVVVEHEVLGREILFKFQDDQPAAQYICDRLLARLDLDERDA